MKQSRKYLGAVLAIMAVLALSVGPASADPLADPHVHVGVCVGTATTGEIGLAGIGDVEFSWSIDAGTICVTADGDVELQASGTAFGGCGRSEADSGTGTIDGHELKNITWQSLGTVIVVSGDYSPGGVTSTFTAVFNARAQSGLDCVGGTADKFDIVGTAALH